MGSDIRFTLEADAQQLLRTDDEILKKQTEVEAGFNKLASSAQAGGKRAAEGMSELGKAIDAEAVKVNALEVRFTSAMGRMSAAARRAMAAAGPLQMSAVPLPGAAADYGMRQQQFPQGHNPYRGMRVGSTSIEDAAAAVWAQRDARMATHASNRQFADDTAERLATEQMTASATRTADPHAARLAAREVAAGVRRQRDERLAAEAETLRDGKRYRAEMWLAEPGRVLATGVRVFGAAAGVERAISARYEQLGESLVEFEKEMRPLLAIAPQGMGMNLRDSVLNTAGAWGFTTADVAGGMTEIQRGMVDSPESARAAVLAHAAMFGNATGSTLGGSAALGTKFMEGFGASDPGKLYGQLIKSRQLGGANADQYLEQIAKVIPAAHEAGVTAPELMAFSTTAAHFGGSDRKVYSGMAEVLLRLNELQKQGVVAAGDLNSQLTQLSAIASANPEMMQKMFPEGGVVTLKLMAEHAAEYKRNVQEIQMAGPGNLRQAVANTLRDGPAQAAATIKAAKDAQGHADVIRAMDPEMSRKDEVHELTKLGARVKAWSFTPTWASDMHAGLNELASGEQSGLLTEGLKAQLSLYKDGGNTLPADLLKLAYGEQLGTSYKIQGDDHVTTRLNREEFAEMTANGYQLSLADYLRIKEEGEAAVSPADRKALSLRMARTNPKFAQMQRAGYSLTAGEFNSFAAGVHMEGAGKILEPWEAKVWGPNAPRDGYGVLEGAGGPYERAKYGLDPHAAPNREAHPSVFDNRGAEAHLAAAAEMSEVAGMFKELLAPFMQGFGAMARSGVSAAGASATKQPTTRPASYNSTRRRE